MFKNCNGTIKEASEGESSNMESVEDDEEILEEFDHEKPIGNSRRAWKFNKKPGKKTREIK